jgi:uncharacterized membrane protein (DUF373 family)
MEKVAYSIMAIYALGLVTAIIGIIYLIIRRRRVKKEERFEKRDN